MELSDGEDMAIYTDQVANASFRAWTEELSDTWRGLLGIQPTEMQANTNNVAMSSSLKDDPWRELLQAQGVELVDLQHIPMQEAKVSLSDLEVEQALQIIQEHSSD